MSVIVSDASPLINLARVNQFYLLAAFYDQIVIPQIALQLGLKVHGTLGILTRAKREGRIVSLKQALDLL